MRSLTGKRIVVVGRGSALVPVATSALEAAGAVVQLVDASPDGDVGAGVESAIAELGGVDVLVNLAASAPASALTPSQTPSQTPAQTPASEVTREHWARDFEAVLRAARTSNQAAFRAMSTGGGGSIVNLADQSALGVPGAALASAAAQAVVALSYASARPWAAYDVRVNVLQPSLRADPASIVAPTLVFLAGDVPLQGQTITC